MQADEFERKIQEKMQDFELVPDSKVWEQVSKRIEKEKKGRKVAFYWLAGFALLAGSAIFFILGNQNNRELVIDEVKNDRPGGKNYKTKQLPHTLSGRLNKVDKGVTKRDMVYFKKPNVKKLVIVGIKKDYKTTNDYTRNDNRTKTTNLNFGNDSPDSDTQKQPLIINNKKHQVLKSLPPHRFYNPEANTTSPSPAKNSTEKEMNLNDTTAKTIAEQTIQTEEKTAKIFKFGFTVYSGISNNLTGLPLLKQDDRAAYDNANPSSPVPNYSTLTSNTFKSGFSFGVGVFVEKDLSEKFSLSAGVDYHSYTAKSKVGTRINSSSSFYDSLLQYEALGNGYYSRGSSVNYSNKYHLIQLPVNFGYRINKNKDAPLVVSSGISPGYVISSNALYSNQSVNIYYVDKKKINAFQLSGQIGVSFPIIASTRYLISAGPSLQYGFTNVTKAVVGTNQHLFFTGIKAKVILK